MYVVLSDPAVLAGMRLPGPDTDWQALHDAGLRHVVRLHPAAYEPAPLTLAHAVDLEDLYGGAVPSDPGAERDRRRSGRTRGGSLRQQLAGLTVM